MPKFWRICLRLWLLSLALYHSLICAYNLHEILHDSRTISWEKYIPYRGDILHDIWIHGPNTTSPSKNIQICQRLYQKVLEPVDIEWPPPKSPPDQTESAYTLGGVSKLQYLWTAERQNGGNGYEWNSDVFEKLLSQGKIGCGAYSEDYCDELLLQYQTFIQNKIGTVVGSQSPWAEALLLKYGARHVTTIEYMKIISNYSNYSSLVPLQVAQKYLQHQWNLVDFAFSFSSLEHDGLGRYGDPLNPYGDLESLARIRCLLKPGGILFFAVPVAPDTIVWNLHRIYGRHRLGLMLLGWNILQIYPKTCDVENPSLHGNYKCQPLLILQKPYPRTSQQAGTHR